MDREKQRSGVDKVGEGVQKVQISCYKINNHGDIMYGIVTIVNNTVWYI